MYAVCFGCSLLTNKYFPIFDIHLSSIFVGSVNLVKYLLDTLSISFKTHSCSQQTFICSFILLPPIIVFPKESYKLDKLRQKRFLFRDNFYYTIILSIVNIYLLIIYIDFQIEG